MSEKREKSLYCWAGFRRVLILLQQYMRLRLKDSHKFTITRMEFQGDMYFTNLVSAFLAIRIYAIVLFEYSELTRKMKSCTNNL